ncbi:hypothetical protein PENSPDRAFT_647006 [Peniophora sp. CONT]|nr:hypothetical protein PENSPDRAFT_647006 [Peniophora sp. CONT]
MADANHTLSAFWRAYARVVLATSAVQLLPEHARLVYLDPLTREIKAASHAYREAATVTSDLQLPPLLLQATNLMQSAWSNRDYNDAAALVARSLPSLPADPEALQWAPRDAGADRWWDTLGVPPSAYYSGVHSSNTPASSSSFGSMPPTPTQTYAPPPPPAYVPSSSVQAQQQSTPQLQMTVPIPEADFPPPRSSKRKDREESEAAENEEDEEARRRMRGKTLVITDEMRSAGVNDPPCERCRDTRRSCVRGPHSACLTCVAGKTACSLVPPKTSSGSKKDGSAEVPTKRRVRVNRPEFHVDMMQAPLSGPMTTFMPPAHALPMVPGNAPIPGGQWAPGYGPLDPNQTFVTRGELQAHEARMESRFRQIVQEEISAAMSRFAPGPDGSTSQSQSSLQPR